MGQRVHFGDVQLVDDRQELNAGGDPIRMLKHGWWQRVRRTPKGWALSVSSDVWIEVAGGEPVLVVDRWPRQTSDIGCLEHVVIISPSCGFLMVEASALS